MSQQQDIFWLYIFPSAVFLILAFLFKKAAKMKMDVKIDNDKLPDKILRWAAVIFPLVALCFVVGVGFSWGVQHTLSVGGTIDHGLLFRGTVAETNPYVDDAQVSTPALYAFLRLFVVEFGDGSLEKHKKVINFTSYFCLGIMIVCVTLGAFIYLKRNGPPSVLSTSTFLCICAIGMIPVTRNIEVGNVNLWPASLVSIYLLCWYISENKWADFFGGFSLGTAFVLKPYFLVVLIFLFFFSRWRRNLYVVAGVITAGIICFLGSLMVAGIDIDAYIIFITEVPKSFVSEGNQMTSNNLSLIQYVPYSMKRIVTYLALLGLGGTAFFASRRSEREDVMSWFFVTNVSFPVIWSEHLTALIPAALFLIMRKKEWERIVICVSVVLLTFFAGVSKSPVLVNVLLLLLWMWQVKTVFLGERKRQKMRLLKEEC